MIARSGSSDSYRVVTAAVHDGQPADALSTPSSPSRSAPMSDAMVPDTDPAAYTCTPDLVVLDVAMPAVEAVVAEVAAGRRRRTRARRTARHRKDLTHASCAWESPAVEAVVAEVAAGRKRRTSKRRMA